MDLRELYQETIIDHNRNPRNHYVMDNATSQAEGFNPLCGDKLTVYLMLEDDTLTHISFRGCGCAISQASASLMTEILQGKTKAEVERLFNEFHALLTQEQANAADISSKLIVFAGVKAFPARVKCATLAWHTLQAALHQQETEVSTE